MMPRRILCVVSVIAFACCIFAEENEFAASSAIIKKQSSSDKFLANIHDKNSSKVPYVQSNHSTHDNHSDKQPRTTNHRWDSEYGDNCCGSKRGSNLSSRPDSFYDRIPLYGSRYPSKYGNRIPTDRYGWQTQGPPSSSTGSSGPHGSGTYSETVFHEGSNAGYRPSYTSESSRKPGGYDFFGGYGHGASGQGGYHGFTRPIGGSGSYGISGTLANGDEFGHVPNYPEANLPSPPNIQAQKAVALKALAGVALLGAAAALATNPILLPLGAISGRRKRSNLSADDKDAYMEYIFKTIEEELSKK